MTKKEKELYSKILEKLDEMDIKIEDLMGVKGCETLIPFYIVEEMESFIGERITFLGIS